VLSCELLEKADRSAVVSLLLDEITVNLWDEDFSHGKAYTRNILPQGCAERAEAFQVLRLCAGA